ncbi:MAG TPA: DUF378 domain-containing protein [Burkholderiaceae bacterium]|nr:DUF378 domain-containing protein [Burkholderiaceae bacterium]
MAISETRSDLNLRSAAQGLNAIDWIALALVIIGGINWGLVGLANFDLVAFLFGTLSPVSRIVYILVGLGALYTLYLAIRLGKKAT